MEYFALVLITSLVALCGSSSSDLVSGSSSSAPVSSGCTIGSVYDCSNAKTPDRGSCSTCDRSVPSTSPRLIDLEAVAYENLTSIWNTSTLPSASSVCDVDVLQPTGVNIGCSCKLDTSNSSICNVVSIKIWSKDLRMIPEVLSQFTSLQSLILMNTSLYGAIPDSLGDLSSLEKLRLDMSRLNGPIPKSFEKLKNLTYLDVTKNMLSGPVPPFLGDLTNITELYLGNNLFSGTLPAEIGKLKRLQHFAVWSNRLTGPIPDEYAQLTSLSIFSVGGNNMSGTIPSFIKTWTNLTNLQLLGNNFEGTLPPEIFTFYNLQALEVSDLRSSSFQLPEFANLTSLTTLTMRNCNISGVIPKYIGDIPSLTELDLSFNDIHGGVPDSLSNLASLNKISLAGNKLNESFPDWAIRKNGLMMDISYNNLRVRENFWLAENPNMSMFDCCSPSSPTEELNMISLSKTMESECPEGKSKQNALYINCGGQNGYGSIKYHPDSENSSFYIDKEQKWAYSCSGEQNSGGANDYIKKAECEVSDVYQTARYCPVSLTYYGFCMENGNYTLRLFFSEILYVQEDDGAFSKDRVFDVYIQDELRLKDFNIKEKAGGACKPWNETFRVAVTNSSLKIQLYWAGKGYYDGNGPLISAIYARSDNARDGQLSMLQKILIALASLLFVILVASLYFFWKLGWCGKRHQLHGKLIELQGRSVSVEMLINATQNFSRAKEIGRGGFGIVYKAELGDQTVAVKKLLSSPPTEGLNQFRNELYALKRLRHDNVVKLLGGYHGDNQHLLIYEYVEKNSLEKVLFEDSTEVLDWELRYNIILGVAKGLKYLHKEASLKIVHRDIKPSNILLDGNYKAKIADFGLARLYNKHETKASDVAGTNGYMAPEYAMRGDISDKVDIYSFGILLLEIVSGKPYVGQKETGENNVLHDIALQYQREKRLIELVDSKLIKYDEKQADKVLRLAMMCADQTPDLRPDIGDVVSVLEGDKTIELVDCAPTPASSGADFDQTVEHTSNTSASWGTNATTTLYVIK